MTHLYFIIKPDLTSTLQSRLLASNTTIYSRGLQRMNTLCWV